MWRKKDTSKTQYEIGKRFESERAKKKPKEIFSIIVDEEDVEIMTRHKWHFTKSRNSIYPMTSIKIGSKSYCVGIYRIICGLSHDDEREVDHIDGNGLNNRKSNLRICSHSDNLKNRRSKYNSSSKYLGVTKIKKSGKFVAVISINKKNKHLGVFSSEVDAALMYNEAAKIFHGEFARPNIIN